MLEIEHLNVRYGPIHALHDVSVRVGTGQLIGILGANGAGKTSLLKTISGLVRADSGSMTFEGDDLRQRKPEHIVRAGISHVPEGRGIFPDLTVRENLMAGAHSRKDYSAVLQDYQSMLTMFPSLQSREKQDGSTLSGGEQQMLAIGRALMSRPRLLLADEVSLGLSPLITQQVFAHLKALRARGITILIVEQNANLVLKTADYIYVLKHGRVVLEGTSQTLAHNKALTEAYLGV